MTHSQSLGKRLASYRKAAGLSAQALADRVGATRAVINNLELGRREDMTVGQLVQISQALGVPPVALAANLHDPMGPSQYGNLTNWEVVECLEGEAFDEGEVSDVIFAIRTLMSLLEGWGRWANTYIDRAEAALQSGDRRDATLAAFERSSLERRLTSGRAHYARLEQLGVDVTWARGDWMTYEIPDYGFGQAEV